MIPSAARLAIAPQQVQAGAVAPPGELGGIAVAGCDTACADRAAAVAIRGNARPIGSPDGCPLDRLARRIEVLAVGGSTSGPQALSRLLDGLREAPRARPILITQHMPPPSAATLAVQLTRAIGRPCTEAGDSEPVRDEGVYSAPGGLHMLAEPGRHGGPALLLSRDEPENFCRPAVGPMLRSVARTVGERRVAVILIGMGQDGADGCAPARGAGGRVVVQDEASSVASAMSGTVARPGLADVALPVDKIARPLCAALAR